VSDSIEMYFDELAQRGHDPRLRRGSGAVRFESGKGAKRRAWHVDLRKGDITVSKKRGPVHCTMRADDETTAAILSGRLNPVTAVLRGAVELEGDTRLLVLFRRLLPGPPPKRSRRKS
jgi:hypothetical protein